MKRKELKPYIYWVILVESVGALSAVLSVEGMKTFMQQTAQPPLSPPGWLFPVVWTLLYALMGISAARIWLLPDSKERKWSLNLFTIQLILNFFWSLIFFNAQAYGLAVVWIIALWVSVLLMILQFHKVDHLAAWLQVPYLVWLTFAAYLTVAIWLLNS